MPEAVGKPVPRSIAVFGASGHIGAPLARHVLYRNPDVKLRLITSSESKRDGLRARFPDDECVVADLLDPSGLDAALQGIEGIFVVTPSPFDETLAMSNFVKAVRAADSAVHIVRILGYEPESLPRRVPEHVRRFGGTAQQHYVAKTLLDASDLPVTYLNVGATYLDNLLALAPAVRSRRTVVWPDRVIPFIDPRDLGEVAANLLLSPDPRHLHQFHTVNNGQDLLTTEEVADILSDVLKVRLTCETSREAFVAEHGARIAARRGAENAADRILDFIEYEQGNSAFLALNDFAERMLGRKPTSVRAWLMEHRAHFVGAEDGSA
ncbi:NAD(P)H-binding protein [Streptomyces sp. NPDC090493]|uniref:NAD(P)H-binding protein n=1 Tax=Streptomyces sp. NPDC090493 TaxID=3365964 RepID=UPI0038161F96